nr:MAG TPA: hypothetical protein [Caudoviricetes sp.]
MSFDLSKDSIIAFISSSCFSKSLTFLESEDLFSGSSTKMEEDDFPINNSSVLFFTRLFTSRVIE